MENMAPPRIAVLGAGCWGTALAILLAKNSRAVTLWDRDKDHIESIIRNQANQRHLPGIPLPPLLRPVSNLEIALSDVDFVLVAVPSAGFRSVLLSSKALLGTEFNLIWASKGLEPGSGKFLHEVVNDELPGLRTIAALSGPSFAGEVARGLPTAVTIASHDVDYAQTVAELFHSPKFRVYTCEDLVGVELGGAVKNVLAIAAGISDGLGYGANARAALITRGLAEIMRLGTTLGGQRETFMGLAGVGDLVLTCTDDQSRNRRLGLAIGRGVALDKAVADIGQAVEGLHSARELDKLAQLHHVEMPITEQVKRVLFDGAEPATAVQALLNRESKPETL
jgi:glycerol-3-phosphate dehydrogenase (NAD(P)+)